MKKAFSWLNSLSREQRKIIYIGLVALFSLWFLWVFIYRPQSRKFIFIKKELSSTEAQIEGILSIAKGRDLTIAITELNTKFNKISSMLPKQDEVLIYKLSEAALRLGLQVKNIIPSGKLILEGRIPGYAIEELPISLSLAGEYRALGDYLNMLSSDFPVLISVRSLEVRGQGEGQSSLEVNLQLNAYLSK